MVQPLWKTTLRFLKLKTKPPHDPAIPLLDIRLEKTIIQKDTCAPVCTAALFTAAKTQKQTKCPLPEEQAQKMWSIYTMEYYSVIKRTK